MVDGTAQCGIVVCATTVPFKLNVRMKGVTHDRGRQGDGVKIWREGDEAAVGSRRFLCVNDTAGPRTCLRYRNTPRRAGLGW